eukprot:COSAG01_NODE_18654_length_1061_cov_543.667360_1_plen_47_part_00
MHAALHREAHIENSVHETENILQSYFRIYELELVPMVLDLDLVVWC